MEDKPKSKKEQILAALAQVLTQPHAAPITTAALALQLNQSEAALYRHFANKAAMFDGLIDQIESELFEDLNHISRTEPSGLKQLRKQLHALLLFSERHPGLSRVLIGDALVAESPQLQLRMNRVLADIETILVGSAQLAVDSSELAQSVSSALYAKVLMDWVLGRWLRYTQSAWQAVPTAQYDEQISLIGL